VKDIMTDLRDRLAMLHTRHMVAFEFVAFFSGPADPPVYEPLAATLKAGLYSADPEIVTRVRALIDPSELVDLDRPTSFWATSLGRLLFSAGGFYETALPRTLAAAVLGCSRQWVHELVVKGELQAAPSPAASDRAVYAERVRTLLSKRLDGLVN
jgi:hypothetical protein